MWYPKCKNIDIKKGDTMGFGRKGRHFADSNNKRTDDEYIYNTALSLDNDEKHLDNNEYEYKESENNEYSSMNFSTEHMKRNRNREFRKNISKKQIIIISAISALVVVALCFVLCLNLCHTQKGDNTETKFVEEETQAFKKGEKITVNDPSLGLIEIEAIKGALKNNYDDENFVKDENGYKAYYIDGKKASCTGIDLSEYQGDIDFDAVKKSGVDYVMLRIGGRYYSDEGKLFDDSQFDTYYENAKKAGLDVGAYFFSQATNEDEAIQEANYIISKLENKTLEYPIAFDWEKIEGDSARTDNVTSTELTDLAIAFCDTVNEAGFKSMIYSNTALMYFTYQLDRLKDYDFWVADYEEYPSMYYYFTMWQYDTDGHIDGIDHSVDLNICLKNY